MPLGNRCVWEYQHLPKPLGMCPNTIFRYQANTISRKLYIVYFHTLHYSGLLTGKFKREEKPDAERSRIGLFHKLGDFGVNVPQWENYKSSESYWNLLDGMKTIAKAHGLLNFVFYHSSTPLHPHQKIVKKKKKKKKKKNTSLHSTPTLARMHGPIINCSIAIFAWS